MDKVVEMLFEKESNGEYINIVLTIIFTVIVFISGASVIFLGKKELFYEFDTSKLLLVLIFIGLFIGLFILAMHYFTIGITGIVNIKKHKEIISKIEELLKNYTVHISVTSDKKDKELLEKEKEFFFKEMNNILVPSEDIVLLVFFNLLFFLSMIWIEGIFNFFWTISSNFKRIGFITKDIFLTVDVRVMIMWVLITTALLMVGYLLTIWTANKKTNHRIKNLYTEIKFKNEVNFKSREQYGDYIKEMEVLKHIEQETEKEIGKK